MPHTNESTIWGNIFRRESKSETEKDMASALANVPIFSELNKREIQKIVRIAHKRKYKEGEEIVQKGQPSAGMYVIMRGEVKVTRRSDEGIEIRLATMSEGDFFGDVGLLDNAPRTATITAITPSQVIGLFRPELLQLIERDPKLASKILFKLAQIVAVRLRVTNEKLERLAEEVKHLRAKATVGREAEESERGCL
ncbi:TPA: cyclic nucleotide-binding domain-containing protein [Candidatus Poribacteria bacterium]|nr:cyclic nucleotide-binding domain-containing protein [Candidatus Poribacteria bacterium]